jgi:hypothetical protein
MIEAAELAADSGGATGHSIGGESVTDAFGIDHGRRPLTKEKAREWRAFSFSLDNFRI